MYTVFTTYLIQQQCPKGMNKKNCPLCEHIKTSDLFFVTQNETMLIPTKGIDALSSAEYQNEITRMHNICNNCVNKQKTR